MEKTWILIADAHCARCFKRTAANAPLTEVADFIYPHQTMGGHARHGDLWGDAGKGHGRTTQAGTQFEPHMDVKTKERLGFARQLADFLSAAVSTQQCDQLVLIAPSAMLGELKPLLSKTASKPSSAALRAT